MAVELVNVGNFAGDPSGDPVRDAFEKVNRSLADLDARLLRTSAIPQGPAGDQGQRGDAGLNATIAIGSVTTVAAGAAATVTNTGTPSAAILEFQIPRGALGVKGDAGERGLTGLQGASGERGLPGLRGLPGDKGDPGPRGETGTVFVGTVTTVASSEPAAVTNVGTPQAAVLNFRIPRGQAASGGDTGDVVGPAGATDGGIALFNGTSGKTLKAGGVPAAVAFSGAFADLSGRPTQASDLGAASQSDFTAHTARSDNPHGVTKAQLGLGNVANLAPADLPISDAAAAALAAKAPIASPALTGAPTAPTAGLGTNTTQLATTAFVAAAIAALIDGAPGAIDTLNELAAALGDDPNFSATVMNALAGKQPLDDDLSAIAALTTTAFGRALLTLADAAALRSAAALVPGTNVQAWDADLDAIAAISTTSYGRSLLGLSGPSALRTSAGVAIGSDVQAYDADLAAIAALTTTAFGRAFLTLADAAATRAAIGAFAMAGGTLTGPLSTTPFALGSLTGGTTSVNFANGNIQTGTLTSGTNTLNVSNVPVDGGDLELHLTYSAGTLAFTQTINWLIGAGAKSTTLGDTGVTLTAGVRYDVVLWNMAGTLYGVIG